VLSIVLLMVFAIAITPLSIFHHHDEKVPVCVANKKSCGHEYHIHQHIEKCLICAAHFEKNYTGDEHRIQTYLIYKPVSVIFASTSGTYADLISSALRGPPLT